MVGENLLVFKKIKIIIFRKMGLMKIFSGDVKLATELQKKIEEIGITTVMKTNSQNNQLDKKIPQELFIQEVDFGKVQQVIEDFRMNL